MCDRDRKKCLRKRDKERERERGGEEEDKRLFVPMTAKYLEWDYGLKEAPWEIKRNRRKEAMKSLDKIR